MKVVISLILGVVVINIAQAQPLKPATFKANNVLSYTRFDDSLVSPDNKHVAYISINLDKSHKKWRWHEDLHIKSLGKTDSQVIFTSSKPILEPQWSHDNQVVYFLAQGEKYQSLWSYELSKKQLHKLFEAQDDIASFQQSPTNPNQFGLVESRLTKATADLYHFASNSNISRLYLLDIRHSPKTVALSPKKVSVVGSMLNNETNQGLDWNPDGKQIAYAFTPLVGRAMGNRSSIAVVDAQSLKTTTINITDQYIGYSPKYSPDGKWLAVRVGDADTQKLTNNNMNFGRVCLSNLKTGQFNCLANTYDQSPDIVGWSVDSQSVYVVDYYKVHGPQLYRLPVNAKPAQLVSDKEGLIDIPVLSLNASRQTLLMSHEAWNQPPSLYTTSINHYQLKPLLNNVPDINQTLGSMETVHWLSSDNMPMEGLLSKPIGFNRKQHYPLLVLIHGGPQNVWVKRYLGNGEDSSRIVIPNSVANFLSMGYVVFQPNPRGSIGYGKAFRLALLKHFDGGYRDVISGVNALTKQGFIDKKHMAVFGWSYGGYLTAWTVTQTDRFKTAIDADGLTNLTSFFGTSDIPWYISQYLGDYFWDNVSIYHNQSPVSFVDQVKTPVFILQGGKDDRVPFGQAQEFYNDLRYLKKPAQFMIAKGQGHVPETPELTRLEMNAIDHWLLATG